MVNNSSIIRNKSNIDTENIPTTNFTTSTKVVAAKINVAANEIRTSSDNISIVENYKNLKERYYERLERLLGEDEFEFGMTSKSELILHEILNENYLIGKEILSEIFVKNYSEKNILLALLRVVNHFDYDELSPHGVIIVTACFPNKDPEIVECAIRCCENWNNKEALGILQNVECKIEWLNLYLREVISNIKKDIGK